MAPNKKLILLLLLLFVQLENAKSENAVSKFFAKTGQKIKGIFHKKAEEEQTEITTAAALASSSTTTTTQASTTTATTSTSSLAVSTSAPAVEANEAEITKEQLAVAHNLLTRAKDLHHELIKLQYLLNLEAPEIALNKGKIAREKFNTMVVKYRSGIKDALSAVKIIEKNLDAYSLMSLTPENFKKTIEESNTNMTEIKTIYDQLDKSIFADIRSIPINEEDDSDNTESENDEQVEDSDETQGEEAAEDKESSDDSESSNEEGGTGEDADESDERERDRRDVKNGQEKHQQNKKSGMKSNPSVSKSFLMKLGTRRIKPKYQPDRQRTQPIHATYRRIIPFRKSKPVYQHRISIPIYSRITMRGPKNHYKSMSKNHPQNKQKVSNVGKETSAKKQTDFPSHLNYRRKPKKITAFSAKGKPGKVNSQQVETKNRNVRYSDMKNLHLHPANSESANFGDETVHKGNTNHSQISIKSLSSINNISFGFDRRNFNLSDNLWNNDTSFNETNQAINFLAVAITVMLVVIISFLSFYVIFKINDKLVFPALSAVYTLIKERIKKCKYCKKFWPSQEDEEEEVLYCNNYIFENEVQYSCGEEDDVVIVGKSDLI